MRLQSHRDVTWQQIVGVTAPLLTLISTVVKPLTAGVAIGLGALMNEAAGIGNLVEIAPVLDARYSE